MIFLLDRAALDQTASQGRMGDRPPSSMTPEGNKQPNPEPGALYRQICPYFSHQSGIKTTKQNKTNEKKDQYRIKEA